ncbi:MAG: circadian clock KaiB family protein [Streptosporangiaceae bacterium]|jgi:circadian clock protein KaiB
MPGSTADRWALTLYVNGASTSSIQAIETVRRICDEQLSGHGIHVDLEVIDVRKQSALAARDQIVAAPTLIRRSPGPLRRIVGDLADPSWVRLVLDIGHATITGINGEDPDEDE